MLEVTLVQRNKDKNYHNDSRLKFRLGYGVSGHKQSKFCSLYREWFNDSGNTVWAEKIFAWGKVKENTRRIE